MVLGDQRYAKQPELKFKTGGDGVVTITWPKPGMYWLEAGSRSQGADGVQRNLGYIATLEVLPD